MQRAHYYVSKSAFAISILLFALQIMDISAATPLNYGQLVQIRARQNRPSSNPSDWSYMWCFTGSPFEGCYQPLVGGPAGDTRQIGQGGLFQIRKAITQEQSDGEQKGLNASSQASQEATGPIKFGDVVEIIAMGAQTPNGPTMLGTGQKLWVHFSSHAIYWNYPNTFFANYDLYGFQGKDTLSRVKNTSKGTFDIAHLPRSENGCQLFTIRPVGSDKKHGDPVTSVDTIRFVGAYKNILREKALWADNSINTAYYDKASANDKKHFESAFGNQFKGNQFGCILGAAPNGAVDTFGIEHLGHDRSSGFPGGSTDAIASHFNLLPANSAMPQYADAQKMLPSSLPDGTIVAIQTLSPSAAKVVPGDPKVAVYYSATTKDKITVVPKATINPADDQDLDVKFKIIRNEHGWIGFESLTVKDADGKSPAHLQMTPQQTVGCNNKNFDRWEVWDIIGTLDSCWLRSLNTGSTLRLEDAGVNGKGGYGDLAKCKLVIIKTPGATATTTASVQPAPAKPTQAEPVQGQKAQAQQPQVQPVQKPAESSINTIQTPTTQPSAAAPQGASEPQVQKAAQPVQPQLVQVQAQPAPTQVAQGQQPQPQQAQTQPVQAQGVQQPTSGPTTTTEPAQGYAYGGRSGRGYAGGGNSYGGLALRTAAATPTNAQPTQTAVAQAPQQPQAATIGQIAQAAQQAQAQPYQAAQTHAYSRGSSRPAYAQTYGAAQPQVTQPVK